MEIVNATLIGGRIKKVAARGAVVGVIGFAALGLGAGLAHADEDNPSPPQPTPAPGPAHIIPLPGGQPWVPKCLDEYACGHR